MRRATAKPLLWPLVAVLERERVNAPADDAGDLDRAASELEARAASARDYAATVEQHAKNLRDSAFRGRRQADAAQSFAARAERHEVCPITWKRPPLMPHDRAHVVDIRDGKITVQGLNHTPTTYGTRNGMDHWSGIRNGIIDVPATIIRWRAFCAAAKEAADV